MKELKRLKRRIRICECVHLALMTLCVALPLALLFKEDNQWYRLFWALGTVIPVQLIRLVCEYVKKKWLQILGSLAIFAAAIVVARKDYHYVYYGLTCIPMLISGLFLPRPKGRQFFTIPNLLSLIGVFIPYAIGQVTQVPLLSRLSVAVSALTTVNFFLYQSQTRLLSDIGLSVHTEVSVSSLIRQNRKVVALFLLAGALILTAIPFLLKSAPPATQDSREYYESVASQAPESTPVPKRDYTQSPEGKPLNLDFLPDVMGVFVIVIPLMALFGLGYLLYILISNINGRRKHNPPELEEDMTIERLNDDASEHGKERLSGYEKKIRRRYERLIKSRAPGKTRLAAMTPTELEETASVEGDGADTIHTIYAETRYGQTPATKERYAAFKNAVKVLPDPPKTE